MIVGDQNYQNCHQYLIIVANTCGLQHPLPASISPNKLIHLIFSQYFLARDNFLKTHLSNLIAFMRAGFLKSISTHGCLSIITVGIHVDPPKRGKLHHFGYNLSYDMNFWPVMTSNDQIIWPFAFVQTKLWFGNLQPSPDLVFLKSSLESLRKKMTWKILSDH